MKKFLAALAIQAIAAVSTAQAQTSEQAVVAALKEDKEISALVSVIEESRGLQVCEVDSEEVVLTNQTAGNADFVASYACETLLITVRGKASISSGGVLKVKLTGLDL